MSRRTTKLAVVAAVAALSLSGCAGLHPGQAAKVGADTISTRQVDEFAKPLCTYFAKSGQPTTSANVRRTALEILVRGKLAHDFGAKHDLQLDQSSLANGVKKVADSLTGIAGDERTTFLDNVRYSIEGDMFVQQAVAAQLRASGQQPTQQTVATATQQLYTDWAKKAGVTLDPRFGTWQDVTAAPGNGSLSVATSGADKPSDQPDLKCG